MGRFPWNTVLRALIVASMVLSMLSKPMLTEARMPNFKAIQDFVSSESRVHRNLKVIPVYNSIPVPGKTSHPYISPPIGVLNHRSL